MNAKYAAARNMYRIAGWGAVVSVILIPIQALFYTTWTPPTQAVGFLELAAKNPFLGLMSLDFLNIINALCLLLLFLGFYYALRPSAMVIVAAILGAAGVAAYITSNVAIDMVQLGAQWPSQASSLLPLHEGSAAAPAGDASQATPGVHGGQAGQAGLRTELIAAAAGLLAHHRGTAFILYHLLSGLAFLLIGQTMLTSSFFTNASARWGMAAGVLMLIPPTWGQVGSIGAALFVVPWAVFSLLVAKQFFRSAVLLEVVAGQQSG